MMASLHPPLTLATLEAHMVPIEGGSFSMGSNEYSDEKPIHKVTLSSFALCRHPVTQGLWREVMGADPEELYFTGSDRPVEGVSWEDCQGFLERLNGLAGLSGAAGYRLPTEAEWEYAARGGRYGQDFEYSGSADLDEVGWYSENSYGETHPAGLRLPNALGLCDMSGNVREWCQDWHGAYPSGERTNPNGPDDGSHRVLRGGSWNDDPVYARVSYRSHWLPGRRLYGLGFRLARLL